MIFELLSSIFIQINQPAQASTIVIQRPSPPAKPTFNIPEPSKSLKPTETPTPSKTPQPTSTPTSTPKPSPTVLGTQTSAITKDTVLQALNTYRAKNGVAALQIDNTLQDYAQGRADYLKSLGKLDNHAKHSEFMANDGFAKLGFNAVAENQGYNYKGDATGLIEKFYASSSGHNKNQLNSLYTHIGIGINGPFTDLVFGGRKR